MGSTVVTLLSGDGNLTRERNWEEETFTCCDFVVFEEQQTLPKALEIVLN